jgi:hypothetical protein
MATWIAKIWSHSADWYRRLCGRHYGPARRQPTTLAARSVTAAYISQSAWSPEQIVFTGSGRQSIAAAINAASSTALSSHLAAISPTSLDETIA